MTPRFFRGLILCHLMSLCSFTLLLGFDYGVSPMLVDAYLQSAPAWLSDENPLAIALMLGGITVLIVGYVGLWSFQRWGRALSLWGTVIGCLLTPLFGPSVSGGLSTAFYDISMLLLGAVLALAYASPVAERFRPPTVPSAP